ncbi:hypothetical protein J7F03_25065 [Streptomyces sp. ISL-43]|uniref:hypothetical protein n=1 Tax=Streptomyces sp. ISL-43 TaxID=2819183 RepID=UPI001BE85AE0|nr:hypothetical protein [Streptomyces sp. ISL-43]MBT2450287.1 hypothetical protein [Streptomyces sp. ISL-43]
MPVPAKSNPAALVMYPKLLEAALPRGINMPRGLEERSTHSWDMSNPAICKSNGWRDEMCADAIAVAAGGATDYHTQNVIVQMVSFDDMAVAEGFFKGTGAEDELGVNPPGDAIDGYALPAGDNGWTGRGITVRQGSVIAKIEYAWTPGAKVPDRLMDITRMVVDRLEQAQAGKNPTASLR